MRIASRNLGSGRIDHLHVGNKDFKGETSRDHLIGLIRALPEDTRWHVEYPVDAHDPIAAGVVAIRIGG